MTWVSLGDPFEDGVSLLTSQIGQSVLWRLGGRVARILKALWGLTNASSQEMARWHSVGPSVFSPGKRASYHSPHFEVH